MSKLYRKMVNSIILPIYDTVKGTQRKKYGEILEKTQWLSREDISKIQEKNLRAIIKHAYDTVPYYHRKFKECKITPDDIRNINDLSKIPILTKRDIFNHQNELVSTSIPKGELITSVSGGTGEQIKFYVTRDKMSWEIAAEYRGYSWAGYKLGDRCVNFWGSPIDTAKYEGLIRKFTSGLERMRVLNTYIISDENLEKFADILRKDKAEVVKGYASSVFMIAKYLKEKGINNIKPRTVITSAEMLQPHYRSMIEDVFGCKVFDYYGSREIGALASECEEHRGFHINSENVVMEFVQDNEPVIDENGLIYVTNLRNYGMPFIRYEIGDVGRPSNEACSCGRGLPLMASLEGRASQFMAVYDKALGRIIPVSTAAPGIISNTLMHVPVESYRIIQESLEKIVIQLVAGDSYSPKDTEFIIKHLQEYLGDNLNVEIKLIDEIPPLPSGKRSVFISKINAFKNT